MRISVKIERNEPEYFGEKTAFIAYILNPGRELELYSYSVIGTCDALMSAIKLAYYIKKISYEEKEEFIKIAPAQLQRHEKGMIEKKIAFTSLEIEIK